jgi:SAM-dependent methyltransferase
MTPDQIFNAEQRARWNGPDGEYWASRYEQLERMLSPITGPLLAFAEPRPGSTVIEVGCGCGVNTLDLARLAGRVIGIDVSEPILALARRRLRDLPNVTLLLGDAAELPLDDLGAELIVSRFGVMFFGGPVAAFANLRKGLTPGGRLRFACWRTLAENPWQQVPLNALYEHAPRLPPLAPDEPGPFTFGDRERVTRILTASGFTAPSFTPLDSQLDLAGGARWTTRSSRFATWVPYVGRWQTNRIASARTPSPPSGTPSLPTRRLRV